MRSARTPWRIALLSTVLATGASLTAHAAGGYPLHSERAPSGAIWVDSIALDSMIQRRGKPRAGRSIRDLPISLGGVVYPHGIGTRSISEFVIDLHGKAVRFEAMVGLDDAVRSGVGSVSFEVWADDRRVDASGVIRAGEPARRLSADLTGARVLTLLLTTAATPATTMKPRGAEPLSTCFRTRRGRCPTYRRSRPRPPLPHRTKMPGPQFTAPAFQAALRADHSCCGFLPRARARCGSRRVAFLPA